MKTLWNRITLECYRHPDDTEKMPWYAYLLTVAFLVGGYTLMSIGETVGF